MARSVRDSAHARWGFTNRTDVVTLSDGDRVVVQRYRRRRDAEHRLRVMRALATPAADAKIPIPRIRESHLDADPPWVMFEALPGVPVPGAGDRGIDDPGFPAVARAMGEMLASFRQLPTAGLTLDDLWADPIRLATRAAGWFDEVDELNAHQHRTGLRLLEQIPTVFAGRPVVLAHGDFAPVNVLTDGESLTGLIDFESTRLADPLFDVAWWAWAVSFSVGVSDAAWPAFLEGAGVDARDPELSERVELLQILRMLELLADDSTLDTGIRRIVASRLGAALG